MEERINEIVNLLVKEVSIPENANLYLPLRKTFLDKGKIPEFKEDIEDLINKFLKNKRVKVLVFSTEQRKFLRILKRFKIAPEIFKKKILFNKTGEIKLF